MKIINLFWGLYLAHVPCAAPPPPISHETFINDLRDNLMLGPGEGQFVPISGNQAAQIFANLDTIYKRDWILQNVKYQTIPASFIPLLAAGYVFLYKKEDPTTLMLGVAALAPVGGLLIYKLAKHLLNKSVETHMELIQRLTKRQE